MNQPIRVLQVFGRMDRGGAETMIMNLYRKIDRSKIQFDFMVHTDDECAYDAEIKSLGGKIYRVPRYKGINHFTYTRAWNKFFKGNREHKVIHGHIGSVAAIYLRIAKKYNCYTIAHSHSTKFSKPVQYLYSYPTRYIADTFFACSQQAGKKRFGPKIVESGTFTVLNNAIDTEKFTFDKDIRNVKRKELGLMNKFVIGHVGRFNTPKNHKFLIDIFGEVAKLRDDAALLLVGDGNLRPELEGKVKQLGLQDKVSFTGVRDDIPDLLQAMDVFLFPSLYEGLGIVAVEAQASGLPCVLSDTIPGEVKLTDSVEFISLKDSTKNWANKVTSSTNNFIRKDQTEEVARAGYDINSTVAWLQQLYLLHGVNR